MKAGRSLPWRRFITSPSRRTASPLYPWQGCLRACLFHRAESNDSRMGRTMAKKNYDVSTTAADYRDGFRACSGYAGIVVEIHEDVVKDLVMPGYPTL